jgi:hypothetical protein
MQAPARWKPARLRRFDLVVITLGLWLTATIRGLDYITGDDSGARPPKPGQTNVLVGIEAAFPLWMWGVIILTGTALLGVGVIRSWHAYVWWGHVILAAVYLALTVGLLPGYLGREWFDGIRGASGLILPTVLHSLIWWRMGRRPVETWRVYGATA